MSDSGVEKESVTDLDVKQRDKPLRAQSHDQLDRSTEEAGVLRKEVDNIRLSLDVLKETLVLQQYILARDFEARIRRTYDGVINDINGIRKRVNEIGDTFEPGTKFKTWTPLTPLRKEILQNVPRIQEQTSKLKGSKSVDFVDQKGRESQKSLEINFGKFQSKTLFSQRQSWLGSSQGSIGSSSSSRRLVPGFGCCFNGDGKTIPHRSYRAWNHSYRSHRHSWGPSRSGSRSTLDDEDFDDRGCLCGAVTDDWRVKVVPYMWEGWPVPGIDKMDIGKLRERMEQMETMRHEIVHVQNEYRQRHGSPELTVTTELAREAQQWSEMLAMRGYAQYSDSHSRGENILVVDIEDSLSGRQIVDTWYREGRHYSYSDPCWQRGTSNFTQMIWKASQYVGIGIAKFPYDNTYVIVAQYQPAGNVNTPGEFRRNVPLSVEENNQKNLEDDCKRTNITLGHDLNRNLSEDRQSHNLPGGRYPNTAPIFSRTRKRDDNEINDDMNDNVFFGEMPTISDQLKEGDIGDDEKLENINDTKMKGANISEGALLAESPRNKKETASPFHDTAELPTEEDNPSDQLADEDDSNDVDNALKEDDLESQTDVASVSASRTSSLYECEPNERSKSIVEIIEDELNVIDSSNEKSPADNVTELECLSKKRDTPV